MQMTGFEPARLKARISQIRMSAVFITSAKNTEDGENDSQSQSRDPTVFKTVPVRLPGSSSTKNYSIIKELKTWKKRDSNSLESFLIHFFSETNYLFGSSSQSSFRLSFLRHHFPIRQPHTSHFSHLLTPSKSQSQ